MSIIHTFQITNESKFQIPEFRIVRRNMFIIVYKKYSCGTKQHTIIPLSEIKEIREQDWDKQENRYKEVLIKMDNRTAVSTESIHEIYRKINEAIERMKPVSQNIIVNKEPDI